MNRGIFNSRVDFTQLEGSFKPSAMKTYLPYFFSYLLVYPCAYFIILISSLLLGGLSENSSNVVFIIIALIITLVGARFLNKTFLSLMKLNNNNKITKSIFIVHIVLIPLTYIVIWVFVAL